MSKPTPKQLVTVEQDNAALEEIIRFMNRLHSDELQPTVDALHEFIQLQRHHASPILKCILDRLNDVCDAMEQNAGSVEGAQ